MKTKFKTEQRVFDYLYGSGYVKSINEFNNLQVSFDNCNFEVWYDKNGYLIDNKVVLKPTLATKEYSLKGFTQKEQKKQLK